MLNSFAPHIETPDQVEEVVSQKPHIQPGLVGLEALATGLIPPQGVLFFLDPVFYLSPTIIDLDHFPGRQSGVGNQKADAGEELSLVPLDLGRNPAGFTSILCLILQIHHFDLHPASGGRPTTGPDEAKQTKQIFIGRQPDKLGLCRKNRWKSA